MTDPQYLDALRTAAVRVRAAEQELEAARRLRDDAIRIARTEGAHTVPEIAEAAGVSLATAKTVLRGIPR